jgi:hypothetical protein
MHVDLLGASSVEDHGRFRYTQYVGGLPNIREMAFDDSFGTLVANRGIELVFATHDSVHEHLAARASRMGFFLVNGDPRTAAIARKKSLTYELFADCGWTPKIYDSVDKVVDWPVIVKPDEGQGGQGIAIAHGPDEAGRAAKMVAEPIFVEFLPGDEITVDCFSNRKHELIWIGPRSRERVKAGITMRSVLQPLTPDIHAIASEINNRLTLRGPWFFQLKRDRNHNWKLLEISCRVGGAMVAQRARGINLPLMAVHDYLDRSITPLPIPHVRLIERNIATRAELDFVYDSIYIDLDDTLIINGFANPIVLAFLYQSVSDGKLVKLITRHASDVAQSLKQARISLDLFDEIIHLRADEPKADYVSARAIFIDNHFPERLAVARKWEIPTFDVDALEFFIR